ncbi:MAG: T9SS type A sorting domain-containing protein [Chitinophagales bacterium]|nr:T9SS type A sorting domain-containing protein [Chitinophagales bacterium]
MKKNLQIGKKIALTLALFLTVAVVNAQTRTASVTGIWSNTATWGGASVPTSINDVVINNGITVTVDVALAECNSLTFGSTSGTITVNATRALAVTGAITLQNTTGSNTAATLAGAGSISCASIVVGGNVTAVTADRTTTLTSTVSNLTVNGNISINGEDNVNRENDAIFNLNSGALGISGTITLDSDIDDNDAIASFRMDNGTSNGVLNLTAATPFVLTGLGTESISFGGAGDLATVNYSGAAQTVTNAATYRYLILSGSGVKTTNGVQVNDKLSLQGTATVGNTITYNTAILEYKGSAPQSTSNFEFLTGSADLDEVIIDNPSGVTLSSARTLDGILNLTNGYLTTTATELLTLSTSGSATTANGAFVNGPLAKSTNTTASFSFPVGAVGRGIRAVSVTPTANTATTYTARFNNANPRSLANGGVLGALQQISVCEYWNVDRSTGGANASVTLSWLASGSNCGSNSWGYVTDLTQLTVARHDGTGWTNAGRASTTGTALAGGTIVSNTVTAFSPFTLASTSFTANPLPVAFSNVKAFEKGTGVQVEWTNLTESDISGYVIERSANGIDFTAIGQVAPRSNQADKASYVYNDLAPLNGTNFYRVKAMELAGKSIYTKSLRVDMGRTVKGVSLYPNPVKGSDITVAFTAGKGLYTMSVLNTAGQVVYRQQLNHAGGTVAQQVSLPSLKAGMYNVLVSGDNFKETKMFVIQ